jgi:hypothetical protein
MKYIPENHEPFKKEELHNCSHSWFREGVLHRDT